MKSKKVILDTNLWISFLISKQLDFIDDLLLGGKIKLIFSRELLDEFLTVAKRPKFGKYFSESNVTALLRLFDRYGKLIEVSSKYSEMQGLQRQFFIKPCYR